MHDPIEGLEQAWRDSEEGEAGEALLVLSKRVSTYYHALLEAGVNATLVDHLVRDWHTCALQLSMYTA